LATRFGTGVIYSYGNMRVAPYSEQFYVGGANSIRAFTVRSIGRTGRILPQEPNVARIEENGCVEIPEKLASIFHVGFEFEFAHL
ncbi:hypothetical protein CLI75_11730, partial [Porphyromonas gingivalis]|uniref:BamA/TamA family outer membrane protein n=1 Tax=Porphyromonas gingivalis TaxID=837 RepID=UPI000BE72843